MVGGGGGAKENVPLHRTIIAVTAFTSANIGLNIFNSWALHKGHWPDFEFPIFYTMWHMVVTALAALMLLAFVNPAPTGLPSFAQFKEYSTGIVSIALCTTMNTGLNNLSLTMVSLFINQVIKACAPLPTMLFSHLLANKTYTRNVILTVGAIVTGSILANTHSMISGNSNGDNSLLGVLICASSLLANALKPVLQMKMMAGDDKPKLAPTVILFYDASCSFFFMLTYWILSPEREASVRYLADPHTTFVGIGIVLVGAFMAFCFNLSVYYFVLYTSALTSAIGANGIKIFLITVSAIAAGVHDFLSWFGILTVVAAMGVYAYLNFMEAQNGKAGGGGGGNGGDAKAASREIEVPSSNPILQAHKNGIPPMGEKTPLVGSDNRV